jgi:flagellar protein FlaG
MLLTIAGVIAAVAVMTAVYPAVTRSSSALSSASSTADERIKTNVSVVQGIGELNSSTTWVDTNSNSLFDFFVWVKNVGDARVPAIEESDLFFGQPGAAAAHTVKRIPYTTDAGGTYPQWSYSIENGTDWSPATTVKVTVAFNDGCPSTCSKPSGTYFVRFITPNGVSAEDYFSQ